MRLNPRVLELAMRQTECVSLDEFGWKFLGKSGTTVRNYRDGKTLPSVKTLMVLKRITGRPLDEMVVDNVAIAA